MSSTKGTLMRNLFVLIMMFLVLSVNHASACIASFYSDGKTASGGRVGPLTAAHRTLPFGTKVKVSTSHSKSVIVTINDRGPFIGSRCIDLSRDAARQLNIDGLKNVILTILGR